MWCVQSLYILLLKHNGNIDELIMDLKDGELPISEMSLKLWKKSTSLRNIIRTFEGKEQYGNLFLKIFYILSLAPSDKFLTIDLNLGGLNNPELSLSPVKESSSPEKKRKIDQIERVKNYLTQLRTGQKTDELGENQDNSPESKLFRLVFGFITTSTSAADILTVLEHRRFQYEVFSEKVTKFLELSDNLNGSVLTNLILASFLDIFKPIKGSMIHLTPDFRGLDSHLRNDLNEKLKRCIKIYVNQFMSNEGFVSSDKDDKDYKEKLNIALLCLESLKWSYRGREAEIVQVIDVWQMWKSCFGGSGDYAQAVEEPEVEESEELVVQEEVGMITENTGDQPANPETAVVPKPAKKKGEKSKKNVQIHDEAFNS